MNALAILIGATAWFHPSVAGSDLWWHLAGGRQIAQTGQIPRIDTFSHTFQGQPWTNHEWGWELLYWGAYRIHPDAVAFLNLLVLVVTFGLVARYALRTSGSVSGALAATWLAAAASHWFLDIRPHVFSLLFVAILLATRERRWAPWLWPPLLVVWVNLHGGFVFGLGLLGLDVLFRTVRASREASRLVVPVREWALLGAAALAPLALNPYGPFILEYPLAYLDRSLRFRSLVEWHAPGLGFDPRGFQGRFFWMATAFALGIPWGLRRAPYLVALGAVTLLMAVVSRRFIPLFGVTGAPVAALAFAAPARWLLGLRPELRRPEVRLVCAVAALIVALLLWRDVRFFPHPLYRWTQSEFYPAGAVRYLMGIPDPPRHLFNLYNWGGYLMLYAPRIPVFIDGRANTLYDEEIYEEYLHAYAGKSGTPQILAKYAVDGVLAPSTAGIIRLLLSRSGGWRIAYADGSSVVLLPESRWAPGAPPLPSAEELLAGTAELALLRATAARLQGNLAAAYNSYEEAVRRDPLLLPAYAGLMVMAARSGKRSEVEHWGRVALEAYPRQASRIHSIMGATFEALGDLEGALVELRRARPRGPFVSTRAIDSDIARVEAKLRARRKSSRGE